MAESTIIMSKQALKLDGSLKPKAFTFLEKLTTDDTANSPLMTRRPACTSNR